MENNKSHKKNIGRIIVCTVLSFLLSVFLTMSCYILGLYFGLFNTSIIINSLDNGSYYDDIISYTVDTSESFSILLGLPDEVFDGVFNVNETRNEVHNFVNNTIDGKDYVPNVEKAKSRLVENVNKIVVDGGYEINEEQQKNVEDFANTVCKVYSDSMKIPFFKYFVSVRDVVNQVISIALPIFIVFSLVAIIVLIRTEKWLHRSLRYICYGTLAAMIMTAALPIYLLSQGIYKRITISPKYVYDFIVAHVDNSLSAFLWAAGILALISLILMVAVFEIRRSKMKKGKEHKSHKSGE